jgi:electron transport complex protein RnfE
VSAPTTSEVRAPLADDLLRGLVRENPIFVQLLGMCPTLAVTVSAINGLAMGVATLFVLVCSSVLVSLVRHLVPRQVRIATYILLIAAFVTIADLLIQAISLKLHAALGAFISLIVVNCLILGRAEAFASRQPVARAAVDAIGMGLGFTVGLLALGGVREVLGAGTLFGAAVLPAQFQPWVVMLLPSGGFFTLAALMLAVAWARRRKEVAT